MKMLNTTGPSIDPWGAPIMTGLQPDFVPLVTSSELSCLDSFQSVSVSARPDIASFSISIFMGENIERFAEIQAHLHCSPVLRDTLELVEILCFNVGGFSCLFFF